MKIRCSYCGTEKNVPSFYLKIRSIFTDKYSFICQRCLHYNNHRLMFRTVHDVDTNEKENNKLIEAQKYEFYKN